jgi:hypothetical protein
MVAGGKKKALSGVGPTRAVDCLSAIWQVVSRNEKVNPADVREIYSEWEPAAEDLAFLDATFPEDAELGYTFKRPAEDGWEAAFEEAAKVIAASAEKERE